MSIGDFFKEQAMPDSKSEEYRYSSFIGKISSGAYTDGVKFDLPEKADYSFFAGQKTEGLPLKAYAELPDNYKRHENYFKNANLAEDSNFYELTCKSEKTVLNFAASKGSVSTAKVYIHVPAGTNAQIFVNFYTQQDSLSIPMIYIDAQENTHVELIYTVDAAQNKGAVAPLFELIAEEKSHVSLQTFTEGIALHRLAFIGFCAGKESHIDLRTGFNLKDHEACDLFVRMYHEAELSTSNQMIKSVADDASQMNFNGLIFANGEAHNIYAYQMLKGMILGDEAAIHARPQLDIEYFELACSHGVSIGSFNPEELFYLKSRGIKTTDAYALLLYGFFSEPFIDIPLEDYWVGRIKSLLNTTE